MNTIFRDLSIVWVLLHCCIMFMFLYESRYSQKKTNMITGLFMIPIIIVNLLSVTIFGIERAGQLIPFTCVLPSLIFFFIMAKNRDTRFLFTFCVVDTIVLEVLLITNLLDTYIGAGNYLVMFFSRLLILPAIEFFIVRYLRKPYHLLQQYMKKGWGVFSLLGAFFYIMILMVTYYPSIILDRPTYLPYLILLLMLVPIMYATVFIVLWKQLALFRAEQQNRIFCLQVKMAQEKLDNGLEAESNLKMLRHDMKHQMLLLNGYIANQELDKAKEYIKTILHDIGQNTIQTYCENHAVNVVLSYYQKKAEENNITLETHTVLPRELPIDETDFAVILSNGLENAIHALEKCTNKKIIIKSFTDDGKIYLEIKNPFHDSVVFAEGLPQSSKENHGYGTQSMAAIVEKNNGIYCFTTENEYFVFQCAI